MVTVASSSASSASSSASSSPTRHNENNQQPAPTVYSAVMTPVNFVVFLVSLLLVDLRYTMRRAYGHPDVGSRLPTWLHQLVFRPQPYQNGRQSSKDEDKHGRWYYHSKQKKLMKMEANEAFQLRNTVLLMLGIVAAAAAGVFYYAASRLYYSFLAPSWT
ncbi:Fc.00g070070.m01.CDS01 [Cosmosporella sp. VM-42]